MKRAPVTSILVAVVLLAIAVIAEAQQPKSVPRIGYLSRDLHPADSRAPSHINREAFREGLRELAYIEGKNITIEYRYAEGRLERIPALTEELVRLKVDIIVADTTLTARVARKVTMTIPIVFLAGSDPTISGGAASLARPSGNVTGLTSFAGELRGKRLELLKEVVPKVTQFGLLEGSGGTASRERNVAATQETARALGVKLQVVEVREENPDFDRAFRVLAKERIGALVVGTGSVLDLTLSRRKILELAEQAHMPAVYASVRFIDDGGLMYYGASTPDLARRGAAFVDRILKGAKPAEMPIERPMKFEFIINLKAAKQIGLTIPPNALARADRVVK